MLVLRLQKSGSGKTRHATHLAVHLGTARPVVLADTDPQRLAAAWGSDARSRRPHTEAEITEAAEDFPVSALFVEDAETGKRLFPTGQPHRGGPERPWVR